MSAIVPWIVLRWNEDADYGKGIVEEYLGDFQSLEVLSQAMVEGAAAAAKVVFLVNPNGITQVIDLDEANNGDFVPGVDTDVTVLHMEKQADFRVALEVMSKIETRLAQAFLLNSSVQRQAERVNNCGSSL